jgi:beta-lactamase class C
MSRTALGFAIFVRLAMIPVGMAAPANPTTAETMHDVERLVKREIAAVLPADGAGGAAVAVRMRGQTLFFNYGLADRDGKRPITAHALFNVASVRKVFEAVLLAQAVGHGELALEDPVADHVVGLQQGGDIRRVTLGQLATHTSGLLLPQDHPPWPAEGYTLPEFIATLNAWKADRAPGTHHMYTHAGYVLLQLALERRFGAPIAELLDRRIFQPLGLADTSVPVRGEDDRAQLPPALMRRAVQGYGENGTAIGPPGDQQSYYRFPGTGQMFSTAADLAAFLAAELGERPAARSLRQAMELAREPRVTIGPHNAQALAWEINANGNPPIVEKNGGLNNTSAYIGMMPTVRLGIVILANRGDQDVAAVGRRILWQLGARRVVAAP